MNIGRYEIVRELGRGGMALVYLARDPSMKRQVAIKLLPHQFTFDPQFRSRFQQEAEVIADLEHAYIVPVYDYGEHEEQPYIVMRHMSGGTLVDRLQKGPLPLPEVSILLQRIGSALDYAHSRGVIHRDVKPGNILYDANDGAYLSDFGIAKLAESTKAFTGTSIIGTPEYISPEQARGEKNVDGRSDIYSLGVVLFHALTGELPYESDTPMGMAVAHISQPVPSILTKKPDLPQFIDTVVRRSMEKDPAKRYPSAGELAQAVQGQAGAGRPDDFSTILEPSGGTVIEHGAGVEGTPPDVWTNHKPGDSILGGPPPAVVKKGGLPRWALAVGAAAVLLVLCLVAAVSAYSALPSFLAGSPTQTQPVVGLPTTGPTGLPSATLALPTPLPYVPVGLNTTYIEYILDASGSMLEPLEGKTRLAIAQDVLTSRLMAVPPGAQVGLRVYGHRVAYQNNEAESCKDIELAIPIQVNGAQSIIDWLPNLQAKGMTPMSESIRLASQDFTFEAGRKNFILLISDGEETCGDDPASVVQYLKEIGIDFTIHVIGLDVPPSTRDQLSRIADVSGGVYHDAHSEEDLKSALEDFDRIMYTAPVPQPQADQAITLIPSSPPAAATATLVPVPNAEIALEGQVQASSIYNAELNASLAIDNKLDTSWFSAGPGQGGISTYQWTGVQDDFIASIEIVSNEQNKIVDWRTGYGFGSVIIQVLDAGGQVVFEAQAELPGTPDPNIKVTPYVLGRSVVLIFSGSEALDCSGFAELKIGAVRQGQ